MKGNQVLQYVNSKKVNLLTGFKFKTPIAVHTQLELRGNRYLIRYWSTPVVIYNSNGTFTLNTGGYETFTTKRRLNDYSPASVIQKNWFWYLQDFRTLYPFRDGIVVDHTGIPIEVDDADKVLDPILGILTAPFE